METIKKILIKFPEGDYRNEDAVENVVSYILRLHKPALVGGYGVYPLEEQEVISQFYAVKKAYGKRDGKQIIHMIADVEGLLFTPLQLKKLGYYIGEYFGRNRQVIFAVHDDARYQHIHMGINTVAFTDGSYCGFFDQREIKEFAEKCLDKMVDRIWFGKD